MFELNIYSDIIITAGASLVVLIAYSFIHFTLGNRRYAVEYLIRNLWIPIVAVAVVSLALNMQFIADYLGVNNLNYFSYDYAIHNLNNTLTNVKAFYSGYIKATTATALGISGAALNNTIGVVGVAPEASLYAVKVLNRKGIGFVSDVIAGIEWSIDNHMQIISMSFGSTSDSTSLHDECDVAYEAGIVLVAAAGNNGPDNDTITYPAKYSSVIAVGATDKDDMVASWSSRGQELELTAPGVDIYSTYKGGTYETLSGTSMACPHVTGTVALILSKNSTLTPDNIRNILQNSAVDLGASGLDSAYGYGRVNATAAVSDTP